MRISERVHEHGSAGEARHGARSRFLIDARAGLQSSRHLGRSGVDGTACAYYLIHAAPPSSHRPCPFVAATPSGSGTLFTMTQKHSVGSALSWSWCPRQRLALEQEWLVLPSRSYQNSAGLCANLPRAEAVATHHVGERAVHAEHRARPCTHFLLAASPCLAAVARSPGARHGRLSAARRRPRANETASVSTPRSLQDRT